MNKNTVVAWRGPSQFDGAPIVVLLTGLTGGSKNIKTGGMLATYIIREDLHPWEAIQTGQDKSICGGCRHRPDHQALKRGKVHRTCYVQVYQAPSGMWKAFTEGRYRQVNLDELVVLGTDRQIRLGSYGEPVAVPQTVWTCLLANAAGHTGYTHAWQTKVAQPYREWCMASVDTDAEYYKATTMGWSTFRVRAHDDAERLEPETVCPASHEAGRVAICATCMICDGRAIAQRHVTIQAHGAGKGHFV